MRTDPRAACANTNERTGWAFVHDLIAHPLMALSGWSAWALRFHDSTSMKAWPRNLPERMTTTKFYVDRLGEIRVTHLRDGLFAVKHPFWSHDFVTKADTAIEARDIGVVWFESLDDLMGAGN